MSEIQAVLFNRQVWTDGEAKIWLNQHGYHPIKPVHVTNNYLRYRLQSPRGCKRLRILHESHGISFIVCFR